MLFTYLWEMSHWTYPCKNAWSCPEGCGGGTTCVVERLHTCLMEESSYPLRGHFPAENKNRITATHFARVHILSGTPRAASRFILSDTGFTCVSKQAVRCVVRILWV